MARSTQFASFAVPSRLRLEMIWAPLACAAAYIYPALYGAMAASYHAATAPRGNWNMALAAASSFGQFCYPLALVVFFLSLHRYVCGKIASRELRLGALAAAVVITAGGLFLSWQISTILESPHAQMSGSVRDVLRMRLMLDFPVFATWALLFLAFAVLKDPLSTRLTLALSLSVLIAMLVRGVWATYGSLSFWLGADSPRVPRAIFLSGIAAFLGWSFVCFFVADLALTLRGRHHT